MNDIKEQDKNARLGRLVIWLSEQGIDPMLLTQSDTETLESIIGWSFNDYEQIVDLTAIYPGKGTGNILYPIVSLSEEVGEVSQVLAKAIRDKEGIIDSSDVTKFKKEAGDVLWQLTALCHELGTTLEEIAKLNYEKLISRLQRDQLKGSGDER